ncbi:hypothetical protein [Thalassobacillus hwangdonensis]|uniref:Peptidyl-prolyl cis-trans isomerase n=1 Tax=Thalassobacillus hwangdonensis TaxID=546108 RepID=A0ABW3KXR9_9BACI
MIVQITGNVNYPITLDPTVWIFDDRKLPYEKLFSNENESPSEEEADDLQKASMRWDREIYQQSINPPVNKSISRFEKEKILKGTFFMPLKPFIATSEPASDIKSVTIQTENGDHELSIEQMQQAMFLFAKEGKPLKENGPVHLYFEDGSNKDEPITGVKRIIFN